MVESQDRVRPLDRRRKTRPRTTGINSGEVIGPTRCHLRRGVAIVRDALDGELEPRAARPKGVHGGGVIASRPAPRASREKGSTIKAAPDVERAILRDRNGYVHSSSKPGLEAIQSVTLFSTAAECVRAKRRRHLGRATRARRAGPARDDRCRALERRHKVHAKQRPTSQGGWRRPRNKARSATTPPPAVDLERREDAILP